MDEHATEVHTPSPIIGGCLCGAIRYRADGEPLHSTRCHCANCRRVTGGHLVAWITVPAGAFSLEQGEPARYLSDTGAAWSFCPTCGSALTYVGRGREQEVDITTATLDDPERFPPARDVNADERLSWVD